MLARLFLLAMMGLLVLSASMRARDERISPVNHALTEEECSACHFAFPAAMLPSASWTRVMQSLESHFGEDASLDEESVTLIQNYLNAHSADSSWIGNRISRGQSNDWPIRITETDHWLREHKNQSFKNALSYKDIYQSDCVACHDNAAKGDYRVNGA
jgi:cytochrome c5